MQIVNIDEYRIYITDTSDKDVDSLLWIYHRCEQIHSDIVYVREEGESFIKHQADAIVSNRMNTKIAIRVADCSPIALMWKKYFAVVHAWWRWLKSWIVLKTIHILKAKGEQDIKLFVWPNIKSCCYTVWPEFTTYFDKKHLIARWPKLYLDMIGIIKDVATDAWISSENIIIDPACTYCGKRHFSYRRGDRDQRILLALEKIF